MKTLRTIACTALVATLLMAGSALMAQPPDEPGLGRPGRGEGFPGKGGFFGRLAEELELSEGQKAEIEALREDHRAEIEPLVGKARAARQAVGKLMQSDVFDEETVRTAARQAADVEVELAVSRARHLNELKSVLTPEQQEKAAELRGQWRERAEHFRDRGDRPFGRHPGRGFDAGPGGGRGRGPGRW